MLLKDTKRQTIETINVMESGPCLYTYAILRRILIANNLPVEELKILVSNDSPCIFFPFVPEYFPIIYLLLKEHLLNIRY